MSLMLNNRAWLLKYLANKNVSYCTSTRYLSTVDKLGEQLKRSTSTSSSSQGQAVSIPNLNSSVQQLNDENLKLDLTFENSQLVCL